MPEQLFTGLTCGACGLRSIGLANTYTRQQCLER